MGRPTLIVVSGPAGSGKTTLAHRLAVTLGCPVVSRDAIKEGMALASPGFVPTAGDPLTMRTYDLFFDVIAMLVRAEVTLVAEAAFQHRLWSQGLDPLGDAAELRILRCTAPAELTRQRQQQRMRSQATRAAHADAEHLDRSPAFEAIHLDAPTLDVDTSEDYRPGLGAVAEFCRTQPMAG